MASSGISVVIPAYTGEEYFQKCLESIVDQAKNKKNIEIVVVIDGPNQRLRQIVDSQKEVHKATDAPLRVHQFKKNQGRFVARQKCAELAQYENLLFVDDRITLEQDFLKKVATEKNIMIPNVLEAYHPNSLSRLLYLFRKKIYGSKKWGSDFESYYITEENFETSPKGTTSLWVTKTVFMHACAIMQKQYSAEGIKRSSDDTKLLRIILDIAGSIYRRSDTKIYYHPRSGFANELRHLYRRGPLFVDYYLKPGTRFFRHSVGLVVVLLLLVVCAVSYPQSGLYFAGGIILVIVLLSLYVAETIKDFVLDLILIPLVVLTFGTGVIKGCAQKVAYRNT